MKIEVISYQSEWPRLFEELRCAAVEALAGIDVAVEHVGSTSVPGLAAKPVIDIDIILPQWERFGEVVRRLGTLGFAHRGDLGIPGREAFTRSPRFAFAHNLYVCRPGTPREYRPVGSPPQVRGKRGTKPTMTKDQRITPAGAGKTQQSYHR